MFIELFGQCSDKDETLTVLASNINRVYQTSKAKG